MVLLAIKTNEQRDEHAELLELLRQWFFWLE
jgi:hypothetical protein